MQDSCGLFGPGSLSSLLWGFGRDGDASVTLQGGPLNFFPLRKTPVSPHNRAVTRDLIFTALFIFAILLLVHPRVLGAFRRFDTANRDRIENERNDRGDQIAHFRHTLKLAEEQVEEVTSFTASDERTGQPVTRWLFGGETFATERDARLAREDQMRKIARGFYMDLPAALRARKEDDKLSG